MSAKKFLKITLIIGLILILLIAVFLSFLTIAEYRPDNIEDITINNLSDEQSPISKDETISITSFNIGYAGLGKHQDFFMDGGNMVRPDKKSIIVNNMKGITKNIKDINSDILLIQEVDENSKRSHYLNEPKFLNDNLDMSSAFAYNFNAKFVPYPFPHMIGKTMAGLMTFSKYNMDSAQRFSLPTPFKWPVKTINLKRCLLVSRFPVKGSDKDLVVINLHLEAYDSGEGKIAQTKALVKILKSEYEEKGNYVIAAGDWNQTLPGYPKTKLKKSDFWKPGEISEDSIPSPFKFVLDSSVPTCRLGNMPYDPKHKNTQHYYIDGFLISPNIKVVQVKNHDLGFEYSDHNPVTLEFKLI